MEKKIQINCLCGEDLGECVIGTTITCSNCRKEILVIEKENVKDCPKCAIMMNNKAENCPECGENMPVNHYVIWRDEDGTIKRVHNYNRPELTADSVKEKIENWKPGKDDINPQTPEFVENENLIEIMEFFQFGHDGRLIPEGQIEREDFKRELSEIADEFRDIAYRLERDY